MSWLPKIGICRKVFIAGVWSIASVWAVLFQIPSLEAQQPSPFDLLPLLDSGRMQVLLDAQDSALGAVDSSGGSTYVKRNPFDLIFQSEDAEVKGIAGRGSSRPGPSGPGLESPIDLEAVDQTVNVWVRNQTGMAILMLGLLLLVSLTVISQGQVLQKMLSALVNDNFLSRLLREQHKGPYYLWAGLGAVLIAVFVYLALPMIPLEGWEMRKLLPRTILAMSLITMTKFVGLGLLRATFSGIARPLESYQVLVVLWTGIMGLLLFPLMIFVAFAPGDVAKSCAILGLGLLLILYVLRALRVLGSNLNLLLRYPLHFLLYLCALEISPLLLAFSWLRG